MGSAIVRFRLSRNRSARNRKPGRVGTIGCAEHAGECQELNRAEVKTVAWALAALANEGDGWPMP